MYRLIDLFDDVWKIISHYLHHYLKLICNYSIRIILNI